jgi:hypothetical protein
MVLWSSLPEERMQQRLVDGSSQAMPEELIAGRRQGAIVCRFGLHLG